MDVGSVTGIVAGIPYDWLALGGIVVLLALDSLRSGIGRASALALSLPLALVLFSLVAQTAFVGSLPLPATPMAQLAVFGVLTFLLYFAVRRMGLDYVDSGRGEPVQSLLAGVAAGVVVIIVWLLLPMSGEIWNVSNQIHAVFAEQYRLLWFMGAYLALAFARG